MRRITTDIKTGKVIADEEFDGTDSARLLHKFLPDWVSHISTVLIYKKVGGHPNPGVPLNDPIEVQERRISEDQRLIDH